MCWVLYVAADVPLPEVPWNQDRPAFNVSRIPSLESPVARQFSKPYLHRIGAHTGCGCGFDRTQVNERHRHELADTKQSLGALREYLYGVVAATGPVELFTCWDGDQERPPEHRLRQTHQANREALELPPIRRKIRLPGQHPRRVIRPQARKRQIPQPTRAET